jgi:D-3-phosphoglycerate dehydrogenase / 2-oxoglutarate reductase
VVNSPAGNIRAAAEHTMALLLALARNVPQAYASIKGGKWERSRFVGNEVKGKILGIIGLGKGRLPTPRRQQRCGADESDSRIGRSEDGDRSGYDRPGG